MYVCSPTFPSPQYPQFFFFFHPTSCLPEEQKDKGTKEGQKDRSADGRTARKNRRDEWDGQKGGIPFLSP